jgi:hypothetical protein
MFRHVLAVAVLLSCLGTAAALVRGGLHAPRTAVLSAPSPQTEPTALAISAPDRSDETSAAAASAMVREARPESKRVPPSTAAATTAEPVQRTSTLGAEARLLRRAIESLHHDKDPRGALAILDEHRATYPSGRLRANADLLRIEALLAIGRRGEALALLESLPLDDGPRADDLLVVRGELRADADCRGAIRDFDEALARALPDELAERALRGSAVCRLRTKDGAADAALRAYVLRFPDNPFAIRARALLDRR